MADSRTLPMTNGKPTEKQRPLIPFGKEMRNEHFMLEDGFVNLNHGSFGTYVKSVRDRMRALQDATEASPDRYIRYEYPRLLDQSREVMADFLGVPHDEVVYVANATTGVNVILRNLRFEPGDLIVYLGCIYGACEKTIAYITETTPAESLKLDLDFPVADDELVAQFCEILQRHRGKVRVALFETISSLPCARLPFERLTRAARKEGVLN
ncbi:pyridoxal phosphate-dependent transferase [Paraphoma chrysanthemicola]|uniref:Pyridoxal phosphate-dependent transferase n=1 Tax=Paraphoma chrysanthemicola TaxID=798071 RepID=A0A8K0R895_9PLEO|nr:pyridoxal phosphate-dependent transferase [Paraphoma chrysanthemicola]